MSKTKQKRWTEQFVLKALEDNGFHPTDVKFLEGYELGDGIDIWVRKKN